MTLPAFSIDVVGWVAVAASILSFLIWLIGSVRKEVTANSLSKQVGHRAEPKPQKDGIQDGIGPSVGDLTDLLKALSSGLDSLSKAGPSLVGLLASILFLAIAAWTVAIPSSRRAPTCAIEAGTFAKIEADKISTKIPVSCKSGE